jgi:hypothetical protein
MLNNQENLGGQQRSVVYNFNNNAESTLTKQKKASMFCADKNSKKYEVFSEPSISCQLSL